MTASGVRFTRTATDRRAVGEGARCINHPDDRYWWLSIAEDYVKSYLLDGFAWCSERQGPLGNMLGGQNAVAGISCFCEHCRAIARERGIGVERARGVILSRKVSEMRLANLFAAKDAVPA